VRIVVKYFSALRDITGKVQEEVDLGDDTTLSRLLQWFFDTYPKAETFKDG
jgi:molybdopterin converting factor small subunit